MSETVQYKCPNCGAAIEYDGSARSLKCPYCDSTFTLDQAAEAADVHVTLEEDPHAEGTDNRWTDDETGFGLYSCSSCGAELIADETTAATRCPYCDNVVVLKGRVSGELKPDVIIPFKVSRESAVSALSEHLRGKKLLPRVFTAENHIEEIKGVYVPFWLFNTTADVQAEYDMTKVRIWADRDYNYTETSRFRAARRGQLVFSDVPVDGLKDLSDDLMESIETFDTSAAVPFETEYLAGYYANRYDVDADSAIKRASERMLSSAASELDGSVTGYDTVSRTRSSARLVDTHVRYAFFPVWLLSTRWRGENFLFAMNGQTGKFVGDLPVDKGKYWRLRLLFGALFAAGIFGLTRYFGIF